MVAVELRLTLSLVVEGAGEHFPVPFKQDVHTGLRGLEGDLALAGQCDTTLEGLEGFLERQLAALQSLDQGLEFSQGSFEIGGRLLRVMPYLYNSEQTRGECGECGLTLRPSTA